MEREEARDLVVKCGGRVVSALSGKVNYLVAGEEAGVAKLAKVCSNHIPRFYTSDFGESKPSPGMYDLIG